MNSVRVARRKQGNTTVCDESIPALWNSNSNRFFCSLLSRGVLEIDGTQLDIKKCLNRMMQHEYMYLY